jgi:hypothetical protein
MTANTNEKLQPESGGDVEQVPGGETPVSQPVDDQIVRPNGNTDPHTPPTP